MKSQPKSEKAIQSKTHERSRPTGADGKRPDLAIGIDLGSGFASVSVFDGTKMRHIDSPIDGVQIPTIYYEAPDGNEHFGSDAIFNSFDDTGDNVAMHFKRYIRDRPNEKLFCGGKYSAVEITAKFVKYLVDLTLAARPDLREFRQFGGNRPSSQLGIVFTTPAEWGVEQLTAYEMAIAAAGLVEFDGFIAEPVAAGRYLSHVPSVHLSNNHKCLVLDIGAGTSDFVVLRYERGIWHQLYRARGDAFLAGHDYTAAVAADIAAQLKLPWGDVFDSEGGLVPGKIKPKYRPAVLAAWHAADEAKRKRSATESPVSVAVTLPRGRKLYSLSKQRADELWADVNERMRRAIGTVLDGSGLAFDDIDHIMLCGGSSKLPGLRDVVAEVVGRESSRIIVATASETLISAGAAEHALFQDAADQAMEQGLVVTLPDETGVENNIVLIQPGELIPADGLAVEHSGFSVDTRGTDKTLCIHPAAVRTGVRTQVTPGRDTLLDASQIIPLEPVATSMEHWPVGKHYVAIVIAIDANRNIRMTVRPTDRNLRHVEPVTIPLVMAERSEELTVNSKRQMNVALLLDTSKSMAGEKIEQLKAGANGFVDTALAYGWNVAVIRFPNGAESDSELMVPVTDNRDELVGAINSLDASYGTPMDAAFDSARELLAGDDNSIAIIFTDGHPADPYAADEAAGALKAAQVRLICVGIGDDVIKPYLLELASAPEDYFDARIPEDIPLRFEEIAAQLRRDRFAPSVHDDGSSNDEINEEAA